MFEEYEGFWNSVCMLVLAGGRAAMNDLKPPLFCDNCSSLCFAELDGAILCAECLLAAVADEGDTGLLRRIVPIEFLPAEAGRAE